LHLAEKFLPKNTEMSKKAFDSFNIDGGTWYPPQACQFLLLQHHTSILLMKKASLLKEQLNTLKTEPNNALMAIFFHVKEKRNAN